MDDPSELPTPVETDVAGRLVRDTGCLKCGYNLRGAKVEGACPECGLPVGRSVLGDRFRYADAGWIDSVCDGLSCLAVWLLCLPFVAWAGFVLGDRTPMLLDAALGAVFIALPLMGIWKLTAAEPGPVEAEAWLSVRRLARWSMLLGGVVVTGIFVLFAVEAAWAAEWGQAVAMSAGLAGFLVIGLTLALLHASQLAMKLPRPGLAWVTRLVGAVFVVSMAGGVLVPLAWMSRSLNATGGRAIRSDMLRGLIDQSVGPLFVVACLSALMLLVLLVVYWRAFHREALAASQMRSELAAKQAGEQTGT